MIVGEDMGSSNENEFIQKIENLPDIHFMTQYRADESNYGFHEPNIIYSCHKLNDIYMTYALARMNLLFTVNENFGDFAADEVSENFLKPQLLMSSLHYYNVLIDLSWQLIWFYIRSDLNNSLPTSETYEKEARECNYEILSYYLVLKKENKLRLSYLKQFFESNETQAIREKWNYSKHRGIFHFDGMGINPSRMNMSLNGMIAPIVSRKELSINKLSNQLLNFDLKYHKYLTDLMKIIFPKDFTTNLNCLTSVFYYDLKWRDEIREHNSKDKYRTN